MRREGDLLVEHLAGARERVQLCAPFAKAGVVRRLLSAIPTGVQVTLTTRWHASEVAAGVSDLEVLDVITGRPGASMTLLDVLHAKLFVADGAVLAGSANLTAKALGWCDRPNVEVLTLVDGQSPSVLGCLEAIAMARPATAEERDKVAAEANLLTLPRSAEAAEEDERLSSTWLPTLGDPARLYPVYASIGLDRMMGSTIEAARYDLAALGIAPGLREADFKTTVARAFVAMPAIVRLLSLVDRDLTDEDATALIAAIPLTGPMPPDQQWLVAREWMASLLSERIEVAPQSFVTRRRPTGSR